MFNEVTDFDKYEELFKTKNISFSPRKVELVYKF